MRAYDYTLVWYLTSTLIYIFTKIQYAQEHALIYTKIQEQTHGHSYEDSGFWYIYEGAHEHTGFWYMYDRADEVPKDTKIQYAHEHVHIYVPKSSNIIMSMLAREDTGLVDTMVLMSILDFSVHICMSVLICAFLLLVSHEHAHICTKIQYAHEHANVDYVVYHNRHNQ